MGKISKQLEERRNRIQIKTYAVLCLILLLTMGFYSFKKFQEYSFIKRGVQISSNLVAQLGTDIVEAKSQYDGNKKNFDQLNKIIDRNLETIFPYDDNYTDLTRQLDSYEEELAKNNNPFEVSNIEFQGVIENENYSILPFRMTIRSSADNFTKFLHLIENSGAFDGNVRLMDVSSIKLSFESSSEGSGGGLINFTVQINAYFQK